MRLTLLPIAADQPLRVCVDGQVSVRDLPIGADPLQDILGPVYGSHRVVLHLDDAQAADTSGIAWLVRTAERFDKEGGRLVLCGVPPMVSQMLRLLGLHDALPAAATDADADRLLARPAAGGDNGPNGAPSAH